MIDADATDVQNPRVATPFRRLRVPTVTAAEPVCGMIAARRSAGPGTPERSSAVPNEDDLPLQAVDTLRADAPEQEWPASAGAAPEPR